MWAHLNGLSTTLKQTEFVGWHLCNATRNSKYRKYRNLKVHEVATLLYVVKLVKLGVPAIKRRVRL